MPRGIYNRKKKVSRPKGSKNNKSKLGQRLINSMQQAIEHAQGKDVGAKVTTWQRVEIPTEPPSFISRLEAATVKYETAIKEAISALKGQ